MKKENMIFRLKLDGSLAKEMVAKLPEQLFLSDSTTFLDPSMGGGQYVTEVEARLRRAGHSDENIKGRVFGVEKNQLRVNFAVNKHKLVGSYSVDNKDVPSILMGMKFDAIVGNPPYNSPKSLKEGSEKLGGGSTLWDKFVYKSFDLLKDGGYTCLVHPIGWRSFTGRHAGVSDAYRKNNLIYVSMNNSVTGLKTFGAGTAYDVVICQKSQYKKSTTLIGYDGKTITTDISKWMCIPSGEFDAAFSVLAKSGEEKCDAQDDQSSYASRKPYMATEKSSKNKYPVVHSVNTKNELTLLYSSEKKGMFGVTKVIFGRRECGTLLDIDGTYACSQDTRYLGCTRKDAKNVQKAMQSEKFISLMRNLSWNSTAADKYDKNGMALLRKDFWKDFV